MGELEAWEGRPEGFLACSGPHLYFLAQRFCVWGLLREAEKARSSPDSFPDPPPPQPQTGPSGGRRPQPQAAPFDDDDDDDDDDEIVIAAANERLLSSKHCAKRAICAIDFRAPGAVDCSYSHLTDEEVEA